MSNTERDFQKIVPQETPVQRDETDRTRQVMLANLRHELRTPLNAIIGYSEMLLEDANDSGQENFIPDLQKIQEAGKQLLALVNDILDPAKIEAGQIEDDLETFGANLRYELRTPLNAVIGYSEILLEDIEDAGQEDFIPDLRKIREAAEHFLAIISDIVNFSKIETGEIDADLKTPGMSSMIQDVVSTIRPLKEDSTIITPADRGSLLVVDDNEMNRDLLSRHLERQGHTVMTAENGHQALEMIKTHPFDLLLLDIMMPKMNGYQVLEILKSDDTLRDIPVIMISALDEMDSVVRCIEMGAEDYLPKPFNPVLLNARIGSSLEKKRFHDKEQAYLKQLQTEQEKSERLLLNILPKPIAERLKQGESTIADNYTEVTVLFADIVGFTKLSARILPSELVILLNEIFSTFDQLAEQHGLEKIKTIGDAYMVVGGLPTPRPDHAEAVAAMALDMQKGIARFNEKHDKSLSIRMGIHTGPVVAGIIGTRKFSYDLWGDTVNTASRMESHGVVNGIQVTAATYKRLKDKYRFEKRGVIQVKGKGEMLTYLLIARKTS